MSKAKACRGALVGFVLDWRTSQRVKSSKSPTDATGGDEVSVRTSRAAVIFWSLL